MKGTLHAIFLFNYVVTLSLGAMLAYQFLEKQWLVGFGLFLLGWFFKPERNFVEESLKGKVGPSIPWNEMHEGDRLAYFLPALIPIVMGCVVAGVGFSTGSAWFDFGFAISGLLLVGPGCFYVWYLWKTRYA